MNFKNTKVLFFYKGTSHPQVVDAPDVEEYIMKKANEMILLGMRHGVSMKQQKADYIEQLDMMEHALFTAANGGLLTKKAILKAAESVGQTADKFYYWWCLDICALIKMKAIKDDNENGIMRIEC
jgi:phage regulator Rha-like protein